METSLASPKDSPSDFHNVEDLVFLFILLNSSKASRETPKLNLGSNPFLEVNIEMSTIPDSNRLILLES